MTIANSGPITMSAIQTEFGGSNPISLSEYYGAANGIPSSGSIKMSDFYGKTSAVTQDYQAADGRGAGTATASLTFQTNGSVSKVGNGTAINPNWYTPTTTGIGSSYEIYFTYINGSPNTLTYDTWLPLSSSYLIRSVQTGIGENGVVIGYKIRRTSDNREVLNGTLYVTASILV